MRHALLPPLEADIQQNVKAAYERLGCFVANFSQGRKTRQTPGIPDLYVFPPGRPDQVRAAAVGHAQLALAPWWHETKRPGEKQSLEQVEWQRRCENRGVAYVLGGVADAVAHLRKVGLVV